MLMLALAEDSMYEAEMERQSVSASFRDTC